MITMLAGLVIETAVLVDPADLAQSIAALPKVLHDTSFGHIILLQMAALLATGLVFGHSQGQRRRQAAALCAGLATVLQAALGAAEIASRAGDFDKSWPGAHRT